MYTYVAERIIILKHCCPTYYHCIITLTVKSARKQFCTVFEISEYQRIAWMRGLYTATRIKLRSTESSLQVSSNKSQILVYTNVWVIQQQTNSCFILQHFLVCNMKTLNKCQLCTSQNEVVQNTRGAFTRTAFLFICKPQDEYWIVNDHAQTARNHRSRIRYLTKKNHEF